MKILNKFGYFIHSQFRVFALYEKYECVYVIIKNSQKFIYLFFNI